MGSNSITRFPCTSMMLLYPLLYPLSPALIGLCLPSIKARMTAASEPAYSKGWTAGTVLPPYGAGFWMDFLGAACDVHHVLLHVCRSQLPASCLCRGRGVREKVISLFCTDGTSAVATLSGDRGQNQKQQSTGVVFVPLCRGAAGDLPA